MSGKGGCHGDAGTAAQIEDFGVGWETGGKEGEFGDGVEGAGGSVGCGDGVVAVGDEGVGFGGGRHCDYCGV